MRMNKGQPFMDVSADYAPDDWPQDRREPPVFSEAFLYDTIGKGDARFVLGVADEYDHVMQALGPEAVTRLLDVKPRLAQRLGVGQAVIDAVGDAASDRLEQQLSQFPPQVVLDADAADMVWRMLHAEYERNFNPEESMDRDTLRAYHTLTEALGPHRINARQKEIDRLPEKLEKQAKRKRELAERQALRKDKVATITKALEAAQRDFKADEPIDHAYIARQVERALREE